MLLEHLNALILDFFIYCQLELWQKLLWRARIIIFIFFSTHNFIAVGEKLLKLSLVNVESMIVEMLCFFKSFSLEKVSA